MHKLILLLISLLAALISFGQLSIQEEVHTYVVEDLENYQEKIIIQGRNESLQEESIGFSVNENAELIFYELYERKGSKWKASNLKKGIIVSSIDRSSFFTGTRYYYLKIPAGIEFKLEFHTQEKHTIFLTKCYQSGWFDADNVRYEFQLPENVVFTGRNGLYLEGSFEINAASYGSHESIPYVLHPKDQEPIMYFSNWFEERIHPQLKIDESLIPADLKQIAEKGTREELAKACYRFVQTQIKYIDMENGINAIIPRQCEKVLKNGLGDCKDMATLLTALYRHFGFEAYSAISRTNSKEDVLDFPSLGLANHTICALRLSDQWYFLDATEDACLFGDPSIQTLGTEVFLVGFDGDPFLKVDDHPRSRSYAELNYVLGEDMNLQLELRSFGKMNHFLYHTKLKEKNPSETIQSVLEQISGLKWEMGEVIIHDTSSTVKAVARMNSSMYSKMGKKNLYNLQFLPNPNILSALFQNSRFPLFDGEVSINLDFGGEVRSDFSNRGADGLELIQTDSELLMKCSLRKEINEKTFKESDLVKEWETLIKQPLLIGYE